MKIIGVTGTNGKTSTAVFIYSILKGAGKNAALCGTLGLYYMDKHVELDLTTPFITTLYPHLEEMKASGVEYLVIEASSHALDQNRLGSMTFDVGVFTNLTQDHLDYHGTFARYKEAKKRILGISNSMVFNIDDAFGEELFHEYYKDGNSGCGECITLSTACDCADVTAAHINCSLTSVDFELTFLGVKSHVKLPLVGKMSVYNFLSAISALYLLGFSYDEIMAGIPDIKPVRGRAELLDIDADFNVMIDFAHTPDALENILSTLSEVHRGRIVTVFGSGGDRDRTKRPLMGEVVSRYSDFIYLTSDNPRTEDPLRIMIDILPSICEGGKPYRAIENREDAITCAIQNAMSDDLILIAGKGHESYQVIGNEKVPFDEEKIVRKALQF